MLFFYNIFIRFYYLGIRFTSLWNKKAADWISGRKYLFQDLEKKISTTDAIIWMHCSSAGEFEQGKPIIEALKKNYPTHKILVSFFSPSGFSVAKNYSGADYITYLPLDTRENARRFVKLVNPKLVIFVKYEFWYHHLSAVAFHHIPLLLVSAVFRQNQVFFKGHGRFFRQILFLFRYIFVQDKMSFEILHQNKIAHSITSGDTRFDRVAAIVDAFSPLPLIEKFLNNQRCIIAGSTWKEDEELLQQYYGVKKAQKLKWIIAPHEINNTHLQKIKLLFPDAIFYSEWTQDQNKTGDMLIIDNVGMLSRLYQYATITYIGGGFTKDGIHNILEAAVWSKPVIFGPNYKKYREATELIKEGGGFSIRTSEELKRLADELLNNEQYLQAISKKSKDYVLNNTGATQTIIGVIQEKRLLTN